MHYTAQVFPAGDGSALNGSGDVLGSTFNPSSGARNTDYWLASGSDVRPLAAARIADRRSGFAKLFGSWSVPNRHKGGCELEKAEDLNDQGHIAGSWRSAYELRGHAAIARGDEIEDIGLEIERVAHAHTSCAKLINNLDWVIADAHKDIVGISYIPCLWNGKQVISFACLGYGLERDGWIEDLNDNGVVCGSRQSGGRQRAFVWRDGKFSDLSLPHAEGSATARVVNLCGVAAGFFRERWSNKRSASGRISDQGSNYLACLWSARGEHIPLAGLPEAVASQVYDLNEQSTAVGHCEHKGLNRARTCWTDGLPRATAWFADGQPVDLTARVCGRPDLHLEYARAINNRGQILCVGRLRDGKDNDRVSVLLTPEVQS